MNKQCEICQNTCRTKYNRFCSHRCKGVYYSRGNHPMRSGHTVESKEKIKLNNSKYWLGKKHSENTKEKIRAARAKQVITAESREKAKLKMTGDKHPLWKGDKVGYHALHRWVDLHKGKPSKCEHCGTTTAKKFEWANIDGQYNRSLDDFIRLCTSCHRKYDNAQLLPSRRLELING